MFGRAKVAMLVAEFLGVAVLTLVVLAIVNSPVGVNYFVAGAAGLVAGTFVLTMGGVSGAHLNPAVTLGQWVVRKIDVTQAVAYIAAQVLGGVVALRLYEYLANKAVPVLTQAEMNFDMRVFVAEAIGAFILAFGITAAVEKALDSWSWAVVTGASLTLGIMVAGVAARGLINPAVALGTNTISWTYLAAPLVGGVIGSGLHSLVFAPARTKAKAATKSKVTVVKKSSRRK